MKVEVDRRIFIHCTILQQSVHINEQCSPRLINTTILIADMTVLESMAKLNSMSTNHGRQYHLRQLHPARSRRTDNVEDLIQEPFRSIAQVNRSLPHFICRRQINAVNTRRSTLPHWGFSDRPLSLV